MKRKPRRGSVQDGFELWGGYMAAKQTKLQAQFCQTASTEKTDLRGSLFHGIAIFVNGYTEPSADELKRIMMLHGGSYHHYMSSRTTHIIASNLPDVKIKKLKVMKVVKPEWIVESLKAGKLLNYRLFLLYSHQSRTQPRLQFVNAEATCSKSSEDIPISNQSCNDVQDERKSSCTSHQKTVDAGTPDLLKERYLLQSDDSVNDSMHHKLHACRPTGNGESNSLNISVPSCSSSDMVGKVHCESDKKILAESVKISLPPKPQQWTAKTAGEANFLSEFYNNSRLHHISTMGATFKQYVNELREKRDQHFEGKEKLRKWKKNMRNGPVEELEDNLEADLTITDPHDAPNDKVIMHIDMDCFFVSVGLRNRPDLQGQPIAVTHAKGNQKPQSRPGQNRKMEFDYYKQRMQEKRKLSTLKSNGQEVIEDSSWMDDNSSMAEIASCSYEARKAGLKNGMFLGQALKLCPNLKTIPYDFEGYKEVSYMLYNTVASYTLNMEAVSCDEMFVDCTELLNDTGVKPLEFASYIRKEIKDQTGCPASTGFGSNLLQARMATKRAKPDGQFHLKPSKVCSFMRDIKVEELPGVGRSMSYKLHGLTVQTCGDLQQLTLPKLQSEFGSKTGMTLYRHCRGEDDRKLSLDHVRKSVSAEVNYGIRFTTQGEADAFFRQLSTEVTTRVKEISMKSRCITLKLMVRAKDAPTETAKFLGHGVCDHITKSISLPRAISDSDTVVREVLSIYRQLRVPPSDLRGVGIQLSRLESELKQTIGGIQNFLTKQSYPKKVDEKLSPQKDVCVPGRKYKVLDNFIEKMSKDNALLLTSSNLFEQNKTVKITDEQKILKSKEPEKQINSDQQALEKCRSSLKSTPSSNGYLPEETRIENRISEKLLQTQNVQCQENLMFGEDDIDPEVFAALPEDIQKEILRAFQKKTNEPDRMITRHMNKNSPQKSQGPESCDKSHEHQTSMRKLQELVTSDGKSPQFSHGYDSQEPGPSSRKSPEPRHRYFNSQEPGPSNRTSPEPCNLISPEISPSFQNSQESSQKSHSLRSSKFKPTGPSKQETLESKSYERKTRKPSLRRTSREQMKIPSLGSTHSQELGFSHGITDETSHKALTVEEMNYSQIEPSFLAALPTDIRQELETDLVRRKAERQQHMDPLRNNPIEQTVEFHMPQVPDKIHCLNNEKGKVPRRRKQSSLDSQQSTNKIRTVTKDFIRNNPVEEALSEPQFNPNLSVPETRALLKAWVRTESIPQPCDVDMLARHFQHLAATRKLETLDLVMKCLIRCVRERKSNDWEEACESIVNKTQNTMQIVYGAELRIPS